MFKENHLNDFLEAFLVVDFERYDDDFIECLNFLDAPSCVIRTQFETLDFSSFSFSPVNPSIEECLRLELKPLPNHLKYAYLGDSFILDVIVSFTHTNVQKGKLLRVLREQKCHDRNLVVHDHSQAWQAKPTRLEQGSKLQIT